MTAARPGREGNGSVTLRQRLAEVEKRVRSMVADNRRLRTRVRELERELDRARQELRELEGLRGNRAEVRERLTGILAKLRSLEKGDGPDEQGSPQEHPE